VKNSPWKLAFLYSTAIAMTVCALFPIYWMINTSLKPQGEIYLQTPTFWPQDPTLESYRTLLDGPFVSQVGNSLVGGVVVSLVSVGVSVAAAYAIARLRFRGRAPLSRGCWDTSP
jgi:multiple sugar transport system permease protein